jgi:uncharacterized protein YndB with AHSA1/START domain
MTNLLSHQFDPKLDLKIERVVDVAPALVWKAWTQPEHLMKWFTPVPWKTIACEIDLRPGGKFNTTMQSPEGQDFPNTGCYLEVVENKKLVWTDALLAGFRPAPRAIGRSDMKPFHFTAVVLLEASGAGTKYTAMGLHSEETDRKQHEEMGFVHGWNAALDQLVAHMKMKR